jgi:class 3 adenylate cyclase
VKRSRQTVPLVTDVPETHYAKTADGIHIAYQVVGTGPMDLVCFAGAQFPVDLIWESPSCARFLHHLASFSRLILFDPTGYGGSDHAGPRSPLIYERWADDALAVLDALDSQRAAVLGTGEIGAAAIVFAATHPDRISALVLLNTLARYLGTDDYPFGFPERMLGLVRDRIAQQWGTGALSEVLARSASGDEEFVRMWGRWERLGTGGPQDEVGIWDLFARLDVRDVLPAVRVPTLVLHRRENPHIRIDHGRFLADHIPGARFVELPGEDHAFFVGDTEAMLDEIEEFLTGVRGGVSVDRVLATVMFSDLVGSTEQAARHGDRAWRELLDAHDDLVAGAIERYRGRVVKTTGDGVLAIFDGPARAIQCASLLKAAIRPLGLEVRAGLHTGEVELRGSDLGGIGVHIAARVAALAEPGQVWVSRTVTDLVVGSRIKFEDRGEHRLKGVPGTWRLFVVAN